MGQSEPVDNVIRKDSALGLQSSRISTWETGSTKGSICELDIRVYRAWREQKVGHGHFKVCVYTYPQHRSGGYSVFFRHPQ